MKNIILPTLLVIIFLLISLGTLGTYRFKLTHHEIVCTSEAKICPDGSTIGRTGDHCEFAPCPKINSIISETEARIIAEKSCIKGGEALGPGIYNGNSKTWWFDANLNATRNGCNPACVVSEETKTAEINWRCTGLLEKK